MNSTANRNRQYKLPARLLLCSLILVPIWNGGCAKKPWTTDIGENQRKEVNKTLQSMQERDDACSPCLDGDAIVTIENHMETKVLSGYVKFMLPDSVKFIAANPLGQPLFALASDGVKFEILNTPSRTYTAGSLQSYALLHDIPTAFLSGSWAEWLTGRIDKGKKEALVMQGDADSRGVWISFKQKADGDQTTTHLLIDSKETLLRSRILEDAKGKILAEITYDDWQQAGACRQPGQINMSRLAFGGQVSLKLSRVEASDLCQPHDFFLPVPASYQRQFLP